MVEDNCMSTKHKYEYLYLNNKSSVLHKPIASDTIKPMITEWSCKSTTTIVLYKYITRTLFSRRAKICFIFREEEWNTI